MRDNLLRLASGQPVAVKTAQPCQCGHTVAEHEHYRAGTECVTCDPGECTAFRRAKRS